MTLGWHIGEREGRRFFYKEGGGGGFHCMMRLYPGEAVGTVAMTNATGFDVGKLLDTIDASFLRDDPESVSGHLSELRAASAFWRKVQLQDAFVEVALVY